MIDLSNVKYAPVIEEITDVLCNKTQNVDKGFYRVEVAYFLAKMASSMRASIKTKDRGVVPVNVYALALASSGYGKGHSVNIMENEFIRGFKKKFLEETMPEVANQHLDYIAQERAIKKQAEETIERDIVETEYKKLGAYPFTFDSGTSPAVKQLRDKLLLAACGSINLQIDEIGSNLVTNTEVLNVFLELYDQGLVKQKLIKNTVDNNRSEERDGKTPTNMLLFGTPVKLFDGGLTEDAFYSFLEIGYARRCLFGIGKVNKKAMYSMTPEQIFAKLTDVSNSSTILKWSDKFTQLAEISHFNWEMLIADSTSIKLIEYKTECEKIADTLPEFEEIKKAELSHRYFKALKLAGALAFVDESPEVTLDHVLQAIKLVEDSGEAFSSILTREKPYMKLAKYIASTDTELTHADLNAALPFYKSSASARSELMNLAVAWGYKNQIIIKKSFIDGIEFFKGETLKKTDLNKVIVSWSQDFAFDYVTENAPWDALDTIFLKKNPAFDPNKDVHWCNHGFLQGHRCNECTIPPFNIVVLDVDGTTTIKATQELFKDYKYLIYTTKSHGKDGKDRFRLILPLNYTLEFNNEDYKEFMNNIIKWLPFTIDEASNQASKKWLSNPSGLVFKNDGELLDALKFIPRTSRNEQFEKEFSKIESMDNLERWFASRMAPGNRNNMMYKYAMALVDNGFTFNEVSERVKKFNKQSGCNLSAEELNSSILTSIAKKFP